MPPAENLEQQLPFCERAVNLIQINLFPHYALLFGQYWIVLINKIAKPHKIVHSSAYILLTCFIHHLKLHLPYFIILDVQKFCEFYLQQRNLTETKTPLHFNFITTAHYYASYLFWFVSK